MYRYVRTRYFIKIKNYQVIYKYGYKIAAAARRMLPSAFLRRIFELLPC